MKKVWEEARVPVLVSVWGILLINLTFATFHFWFKVVPSL